MMLDIFIYIGLLFLGLGIGWFANEFYKKRKINKAIYKAEDIVKQAEREADKKKNDILLKAKEERFRLRDNLEKEYHERQESLEDLDQKLQNADKLLEERELLLNTKESLQDFWTFTRGTLKIKGLRLVMALQGNTGEKGLLLKQQKFF